MLLLLEHLPHRLYRRQRPEEALSSSASAPKTTGLGRIVISLVPIVLGGLIYLVFRPMNLIMFSWVSGIGGDELLQWVRILANPVGARLPDSVLFAVPNGLWLLSYFLLLGVIWTDELLPFLGWSLLLYGAALVTEFLQLDGIMHGTFDLLDLAAYTVAMIMGAMVFHMSRLRSDNG